MPIYYEIPQSTLYLGSELNIDNADSIDLFYKVKKRTEHIYSGTFKTDLMAKYNFIDDIYSYLRNKKFLQTYHLTQRYSPSEYQFPKCCWLASSILAEGLKSPLSIHYNPRLQKHVVHPGQTRSYIAQLFQTDSVRCLYFNTSGVQFPWMKDFFIVEKSQLEELKPSHFSLAADHGALIPHVFFGNQNNTLTEVFKYHDFIRNRLSNMQFRIKSNLLITPLEHWTTNDDSAHIEIFIKNTRDADDVARACILAVLGRPYKSNTLEVKVNPL
jgi:hypothetical protein